MYLSHIFYNVETFLTILLGLVATIGDWLVQHSNLDIYKALFDNTTHSIIGGLTWFIVSLKFQNKSAWFRLKEVGLCALIASLIDLDHFIAARSIYLKDATNLQGRPFLHCSTIPIAVTIILLILSRIIVSENIYHFAWIIFAAFSSHHVRDATRRGFWFYHFGSTPAIPYYLYVVLSMFIPHFISYFLKIFYIHSVSDKNAYTYLQNV